MRVLIISFTYLRRSYLDRIFVNKFASSNVDFHTRIFKQSGINAV